MNSLGATFKPGIAWRLNSARGLSCQFQVESATHNESLWCFFWACQWPNQYRPSLDAARLKQTLGLPAVGRSYPIQVSSTHRDDMPANKSYWLRVSPPVRVTLRTACLQKQVTNSGSPLRWELDTSGQPACREATTLGLLRAVLSLSKAPLYLAHPSAVCEPHFSWIWEKN